MKRSLFTVSAIALAVLTGCNSTDEVTAEQPLYVSTVAVDVPVKANTAHLKAKSCLRNKRRLHSVAQAKFSMC